MEEIWSKFESVISYMHLHRIITRKHTEAIKRYPLQSTQEYITQLALRKKDLEIKLLSMVPNGMLNNLIN